MAGEWPEAPLGELVQNFDSRRIPLSSREREKRRGQYPYYGATGVMDRVDDFLFEGLHLLVAEDGSVERPDGKPFLQLVDGRFWVNNHAHVLKGSTDEDTRFLFYALSTVAIRPYMSGSVQAKLSQGNLNRIPTPYPTDETDRRAIAHILGTLDDKIELNRRMNETLEAMARALFKSWFVDFDPVRAKAEGRDPGLPKPLADLFPARFVDSELGEIPEGWEVVALGELIDTIKGRSYKSEELIGSDTALVTLKSFARGGGYRPDGLKSFAGPYKAEQVVKPGELVIACTDVTQAAEVIGRPAIVRGTSRYRRLVASLDTLIVRPRDSSVTRAFLYFLGGTEAFVTHTYAHTTGTTVLHLAKEAVPSFTFARPSKQLVEQFDALAGPALERVQSLDEESGTLVALRDTLLPKLISGEVRVEPCALENVKGGTQ